MYHLLVVDLFGHEATHTDAETGEQYTIVENERGPRFAHLLTREGDAYSDQIAPVPQERIVPDLGLGMWEVWTPHKESVDALYLECADVLLCEVTNAK